MGAFADDSVTSKEYANYFVIQGGCQAASNEVCLLPFPFLGDGNVLKNTPLNSNLGSFKKIACKLKCHLIDF